MAMGITAANAGAGESIGSVVAAGAEHRGGRHHAGEHLADRAEEQVPMMLEFSLASVAWTLQRAMGVGQRMGSPSRSMRYPSWRANHGSRGCRPCVR
ncbi:Os11g0464001 [Oryza sativa Japonica Group]|uniref:Os11g0464001 protein n=1 Tax=Oryza sativa subsp. japonica TaxID=39947 RepID=A0A0P0Y261_ORYSJ|nr:hypothetical protein DAI22_11g128900 [Oryza sativa Japonica Group]BAT13966.1 Os11g0464001 [Oryza sativa Japonica Group]